MLPIICVTLLPRLGHATREAHVWSTSPRYRRVAAVASCDMGWILAERGVRCDWSVAKRLEACVHAEGGHSEHLLAWHSSCHTSQPVLFRATNASPQLALFRATNIWRNTTNLQSNESVTFHKLVWRHFQVGWASGLQFVLFWDNANN